MTCTVQSLSLYMDDPVPMGGTGLLSGYLTDEAGDDLALVDVQTVTLTLKDFSTGAVINSRSAVNIKNANGGTLAVVTVDGVARLQFKYLLTVLDNVILDATLDREAHVATVTWGYDNDRVGKVAATFIVTRMEP